MAVEYSVYRLRKGVMCVMRRKGILMLLLIVIFVAAYLISTCFIDYNYVSTVVATIVAGLGIFGVWFQLKKDADIKEAEFLMDYNFSFLTEDKFVKMERRLELDMKGTAPLNLTDDEKQDLVDYLVYLESLAPLIRSKLVRLEMVDDLFGYRYFIAVNNPVVQESELFPDAEYYRGCFSVYQMWSDYRTTRGIIVPRNNTALDKWSDFDKYAKRSRKKREVQ